jgi:hypothetical protein
VSLGSWIWLPTSPGPIGDLDALEARDNALGLAAPAGVLDAPVFFTVVRIASGLPLLPPLFLHYRCRRWRSYRLRPGELGARRDAWLGTSDDIDALEVGYVIGAPARRWDRRRRRVVFCSLGSPMNAALGSIASV